MKKSTIKGLGKGLQQEFKPPEDLPFPLQKALQALAELPAESDDKRPADEIRKTSNGR